MQALQMTVVTHSVLDTQLSLQDGSVHDYLFDQETCDWVRWMATVPAQELPPSLTFNEIIVQTIDTVRYSYLMRLLITHGHHTLFTGVSMRTHTHIQTNVFLLIVVNKLHAVPAQLAGTAGMLSWYTM